MSKARIHMEIEHCFYCPWCVEHLADKRDEAFDYPDVRLWCRSARQNIVERVRNCEAPQVKVPEWCPFIVKE